MYSTCYPCNGTNDLSRNPYKVNVNGPDRIGICTSESP